MNNWKKLRMLTHQLINEVEYLQEENIRLHKKLNNMLLIEDLRKQNEQDKVSEFPLNLYILIEEIENYKDYTNYTGLENIIVQIPTANKTTSEKTSICASQVVVIKANDQYQEIFLSEEHRISTGGNSFNHKTRIGIKPLKKMFDPFDIFYIEIKRGLLVNLNYYTYEASNLKGKYLLKLKEDLIINKNAKKELQQFEVIPFKTKNIVRFIAKLETMEKFISLQKTSLHSKMKQLIEELNDISPSKNLNYEKNKETKP